MGPPTESREKHETGHMLCFSPRPHGMDEREEDKRTEGFCTDTFERFSSFLWMALIDCWKHLKNKYFLVWGSPSEILNSML